MPAIRTPKPARAADGTFIAQTAARKYNDLLKTPTRPDAHYTEGDLIITSSDNLVFKVPHHYMLASSTVIRDTYAIGTGLYCEINLDDKVNECADTVRLWIGIMTGRSTPEINRFLNIRLRKVLTLARKFDCPQVISTCFLLLGTSPAKAATWAYSVAITGAMFDNPDLVAASLKASSKEMIVSLADDPTALSRRNGDATNPANWAYNEWRLVPTDYAWAIQRAFDLGTTDRARSEKFMVLFEKVRAYNDN